MTFDKIHSFSKIILPVHLAKQGTRDVLLSLKKVPLIIIIECNRQPTDEANIH